jgi:hypothetical protein
VFLAFVEIYPDAQLAAFHLKRIRGGQSGIEITVS